MSSALDITKRTIGLNFKNGSAVLLVWSPLSKSVAIKVNDELMPLSLANDGYWHLSTNKIQPGDLYKLVLDDEQELPDAASLAQPNGVHGPSEATDVNSFKWTDENWQNIPLHDFILYELHTGTFSPEGTFGGIQKKLDYLVALGINAIEIMPVAQFPSTRNWGYDGVFPFAVQCSYGGVQGLQQLVNACHQKGIAVVLDVVYNHMGPEGNYLGAFGPYFTDKYDTPWGNAINFDDAYCDGVRRFFVENVLMWFRDFHIDALRLDAVHAIKDFSAMHLLREIKLHVNELMKTTGRPHHLIVELDLNDTRFINPLEREGFGMDAQWIDEFHHALRIASGGDKTGYYIDFNGVKHLAKSYQDAYVYDGQYSEHRKRKFGIKATDNPGQQFIVFSQNHDQVGNRMLGERTSKLASFSMQKLLAAAVMVSPYLPMLFMGEEYSETNPFLYFVSHTDPELAEAVCEGRKAEFADFHAKGEAPDPMDEATFDHSKLQWHLLYEEKHLVMFTYYQALIQCRKQKAALRNLNRTNVSAEANETNNTLLLHRWHQEEQVVCAMNFSTQVQTLTAPAGKHGWKKLLASQDLQWDGPLDAPERTEAQQSIILQPESMVIFSNDF